MTEAGWRTRSTGRQWWSLSGRWRLCLKKNNKSYQKSCKVTLSKKLTSGVKSSVQVISVMVNVLPNLEKDFISFGVFGFHVINKRVTRSQNFPSLPNASSYQLCSTQHLHGYKTRLKSGRKEFVETFPSFYFAMHLNL